MGIGGISPALRMLRLSTYGLKGTFYEGVNSSRRFQSRLCLCARSAILEEHASLVSSDH